jgi:hypothetical protein
MGRRVGCLPANSQTSTKTNTNEKRESKNMKKTLMGAVMMVVLLLGLPAFGLDDPVNGFGVGTTNGATTLSWAIVPARSANNGAPAVAYISATSDKAASKVQFYKVTAQTTARYATNSTVTLYVTATNGFASGDAIIIRHMADDSYEKRTLTGNSAATNLVTTAAPLGAVVPGDMIYRVTTTGAGAIACGAATITPSGQYLYVGQIYEI